MKVSLNTVKQLTNIELPPIDELVSRINSQLGGVDEVIDLGARYKEALIVKVVECEKHPNADKLSLCQIDAGTGELVQVVCGANNVYAGMWAVWLPPKSIVPSTFTDEEPFVLDARELRGQMSHGMLASARELALGDDHDGIVEITDNDLPQGGKLEAGASFAETFGLDDTIIDIENKMFTHRPDLFGQLGVAREIYAICQSELDANRQTDIRFEEPDWYWDVAEFADAAGLEIDVFNDAPDKAPRFMAVAMSGVKVKPSPLWLQTTLVRWGGKPISNVVDLTNYIMLLTAQPIHAYDYSKLRGNRLGVRMARDGEKVTLLNNKVYELSGDDIVIADGESAVGLAGVMGGADSEVDDSTTDIVLEVANFDMYTVRKTSMRYGLFTDALTRFNKGQSPLQNDRVLKHAMELMADHTGARQASKVHDHPEYSGDKSTLHGEVIVDTSFINQRLGLDLTPAQVGNLLRRVNFAVFSASDSSSQLSITAPYWRTDIVDPEDVVEEVGRLYGFDKLPRELPRRSIRPAPQNQSRTVKQSIRDSMTRAGCNEVLTYSFVHENTLNKAGQDASQAFQLSNALSPDLQLYRLSVLPSLLDKVHMNIKAGHDEFVLYEIGKGHNKKYHADDDQGLPSELEFIDAVYASKQPQVGAAFYRVRRLLDQLAHDHGLELVYTAADTDMDYPVTAPFDLSRSAMAHTVDGEFVGMIGELRQAVIRSFKLPAYTAAMTLDLKSVGQAISSAPGRYTPLSRYPSVWQDLSVRVARNVSYGDLTKVITDAVTELAGDAAIDLKPTTIYQPADNQTQQTITYRITATHHERTLTDDDLRPLIDRAVQAASAKHGAKLS